MTTYAQSASYNDYQRGESLKVLTLNTWLIPMLGKKAGTRSQLIGKEAQAYDLAFMQEVFLNKDRKKILKNLNSGDNSYHHHFEKGNFLKLNPGLLNTSKFPLTESNFMQFSDCLDEQCHARKGILHNRIKLNSKLEIDVYNAHFQPFASGDITRTKQMQQAVHFIDKTNQNKRPVLFIGDFNTSNSKAPMFEILNQEGFKDGWIESQNTHPGHTWDSYINPWSRKIDTTKYSKHRLDYIFVRGTQSTAIVVDSAKIVFNKPFPLTTGSPSLFLSDHFGIEINIQFLDL